MQQKIKFRVTVCLRTRAYASAERMLFLFASYLLCRNCFGLATGDCGADKFNPPPPPHGGAPGGPVTSTALVLGAALAAGGLFGLFQLRLLPKAWGPWVSKVYFWPTLPFTMIKAFDNYWTKMDGKSKTFKSRGVFCRQSPEEETRYSCVWLIRIIPTAFTSSALILAFGTVFKTRCTWARRP